MEKNSQELESFKNHFENSTGIRVMEAVEERTYYHWKRLLFPELNSEHMEKIGKYIKNTFSQKGNYSHLLPKLHAFDRCLALTVDEKEIKKFIINKK